MWDVVSRLFKRRLHAEQNAGKLEEVESALRLSQQRLEFAVQGSNDGLWDWNVTTDDVFYSPRFKELLGYKDHEMDNVLDAWKSRLHPDDLYPTMAAVDRHLKQREPYDVEYRLRTKSEGYRWFRARGQAIWDEDGNAKRMAGSITDIAARKQAEEELRGSQRLYLSLVENLPVYLIRKNLDGHFTFANQAFCELLGKSRDELVGTTDFDYYECELAEKYRRDDQWVAETGRCFEDIEENDDGKDRRFFEVRKTPVYDADGRIDGTQAIFWDVTDRKQAELALQEAKEAAEEANRAKSEFLANMSHEIRTPLNAVIGMTELVLETKLTPHQRDCLSTALEAGESLLSVINQILDFSKIEARQLEIDPVRFELREMIGNTLKSMALRAHRKGIELAWRVADGTPDVLVGDRTRLRQIIVNLVGNAIKFTKQGEVILNVDAERRVNGEIDLKFSVSDTGIGISPDKLEKIFEAFQQADNSMTRKFGGTGLGLAISTRLAELMGGRVWVESNVGQGSTFHFIVHLKVEQDMAAETSFDATTFQGTPALIVDDNATNRQILEEILAAWGMSVDSVDSGQAALSYLHRLLQQEQRLPLLVTDVNMPEMDGFALSEEIRADPALRNIKIIMLTSRGSGDYARYAELGVIAHLIKPVKQSELFDAVAAATGAIVASTAAEGGEAESSGLSSLRVLLAEDGVANQKLAVGVLEKWGHAVTVANDGKEAVDYWAKEDFDLILMDIQMPEMDGFEATAMIRQQERSRGRRTPIVAMTAHAMAGDKEKCLEAGMDGYVAKPMRQQALLDAIEPLFRKQAPAAKEAEETESQPTKLDMSTALESVENDESLLRVVLDAMLEETPRLVEELQQAIRYADAPTVQRVAHTIKGTLRLFPDQPARDLALRLEEMGRDDSLEGATDVFDALRVATEDFCKQLREALGGQKSDD